MEFSWRAGLCLSGLLQLAACGGGGGSNEVSLPTPVLSAPASATVGEVVTLDGTQSLAAPGYTLSYAWTLTTPSGTQAPVGNATSPFATFAADTVGKYSVALTVTLTGAATRVVSPAATAEIAVAVRVPKSSADILAAARAQALVGAALSPPDAGSPTLARGGAGAASQISASRLIAWDSGSFRYSGFVRSAGTQYPDPLFGSNQAVSYSAAAKGGNFLAIDFITDAASFEVFQKGLSFNSWLRAVVDGRLANTAPLEFPNDGELYLSKVDFGSKATRHIRLLMNGPYFGGVRIGAGDTLTKPTDSRALRAMFVGDSITESSAGQNAPSSFAPLAADLLGWSDAWLSGVGATGYLAAPSPKLTFRQRYASDVKPFGPDILVIAGGINDTAFSDAQIQQEAALLFDQVQADLPNTLVFVLGPIGSSDRVRPGINAALKAATGTRANFHWVPNVDARWIGGSGNAGTPTGDGNADLYISSDATHPTPAGISYVAAKLAAWIKGELS